MNLEELTPTLAQGYVVPLAIGYGRMSEEEQANLPNTLGQNRTMSRHSSKLHHISEDSRFYARFLLQTHSCSGKHAHFDYLHL